MNRQLLKGILLVAGTSIGGGMLALPVLTSLTGFFPALLVYLLCWIFMAATGLIILEICFWLKRDANLITMAEVTLGAKGKAAAWVLYLFLFYCLSLAYIVGCGDLVMELLGERIPEWMGSLLFLVLFAPIVYAGANVAGRINLIFMIGLGVSYLAFVILGISHVKMSQLNYHQIQYLPAAFPIAFTAFAYQGIIPTLVGYLDRDIRNLRIAIIVGSFLPFVVYAIWQGLIMGIIPVFGPGGLQEALSKGDNAVHPLKQFIGTPAVYIIGQFFAFFALVTSFLGVSLGLLDFLSDGLSIKKDMIGKLILSALIFVPPLIISYIHPGVFLFALDLAGGFGCALLLGLLPILMLWSGRYDKNFSGEYRFVGEKATLMILLSFVGFVIGCQFYQMIKME